MGLFHDSSNLKIIGVISPHVCSSRAIGRGMISTCLASVWAALSLVDLACLEGSRRTRGPWNLTYSWSSPVIDGKVEIHHQWKTGMTQIFHDWGWYPAIGQKFGAFKAPNNVDGTQQWLKFNLSFFTYGGFLKWTGGTRGKSSIEKSVCSGNSHLCSVALFFTLNPVMSYFRPINIPLLFHHHPY